MVSQDTPPASAKPSQTLRIIDFPEISARIDRIDRSIHWHTAPS
jgi:hypothetical protein